jgi:hypothetical protein
MSGAIPPLPSTSSWRSAQLKRRDNFTFTFNPALTVQQCVHFIKRIYFICRYIVSVLKIPQMFIPSKIACKGRELII